MKKDTIHVALDDSKRKIVAGILRPGTSEPELREIPNSAEHIRRLVRRLRRDGEVAACYEAGVSGYDLYRQITALEAHCDVIAPGLTPRRPGNRIKTNSRDAATRVRLYRAGELTPIHVPDEAEEAVRDLVRCRDDVRRDVLRWRHRLLKFLMRHGRVCLLTPRAAPSPNLEAWEHQRDREGDWTRLNSILRWQGWPCKEKVWG